MSAESPLILIVDDNMQNLQILGNILKNNGYTPVAVTSGHEALNFAEKKKPDLIILDIMMPEIDGIEVCRIVKENEKTKNIPVIFITALTDTEDKLRGFCAGGVDYITKPFVKEEVLMRIDVHIRLKLYMERLESLSVTDELTGAYNRRFAYKVIERQINEAKRSKQYFVICYLDIDNLKTVNDNCGHAAGDRLIITFVQAINEEIRSTDYIFRMGGDEFLVLFPHLRLKDKDLIIRRFIKRLQSCRVNNIAIEFSYGFSFFDFNDELPVDDLIKEADEKMYANKRQKHMAEN